MKFDQKQDGSCDILFSEEEIKILNKHKKLHLSQKFLKDYINNMGKILFELNEKLDEKTKNLTTLSNKVDTEKPKD